MALIYTTQAQVQEIVNSIVSGQAGAAGGLTPLDETGQINPAYLAASLAVGNGGAISPASTPPADGINRTYFPDTTGTYADFSGLEVDITDGLNIIVGNDVDGFEKVVYPIDLSNYLDKTERLKIASNSSKWFLPQEFEYSDSELKGLGSIISFYSSTSGFYITSLSKGHSVDGNKIVVSNGTITTTIAQDELSGLNVYQRYVSGIKIVIEINWDYLFDSETLYIDTTSPKFLSTLGITESIEENSTIFEFPNSPLSTFSTILKSVNKDLLFAATNVATIRITKSFTEISNRKISMYFKIDSLRQNGVLIGFADSSGIASRIFFGYEPVFNNITWLIDGGGVFVQELGADDISDGLNYIAVEYKDGDVIGYFNEKKFRVNRLVNLDFSDRQSQVCQMKVKNSDFLIKDLDVDYSVQGSYKIQDFWGKSVLRYRTGEAKGNPAYNDWCFVRTPDNYNPSREIPYPFVICNHGNGWTMNGTEERANYSSKTQFGVDAQNDGAYLDTENPYYKLYSNETIERLLEAGYVVCGTQNYDDNLYGNSDCRRAAVGFYEHMVNNWNVEKACYMIGASNGAMTTLNALYLLGAEKIKAIVLQYPLTCLWRHYSNYPSHQGAIEAAYGIASGLSESEFELATRTHDPEKANTITVSLERYKTGAFTPVKIWYSMEDTVTAAVNNSIPFLDLLEESKLINESVVATGTHGDWTHFDPVATLEFFNKYK